MEYCGHVLAGAPSCYLDMLDKLEKQICRTARPTLATSLEPLGHCRNVATVSALYGYYWTVNLSWFNLFRILILVEGPLVNLFLDFIRVFMSSVVFFLHSLTLEFSACRMLSFEP